MRPLHAAGLLALLLLCHAAPAPSYDPTTAYDVRQVEGWTVRVNQRLLRDDPQVAADVLRLLQARLVEVARVLPVPAVEKLRRVTIWMEVSDKRHPCACYHPSKQWLTDNGYNPDKAGCVDLANARNFLAWSKDQPAMVLHELAHAYHHQVLGYNNRDVRDAYDKAKSSGKYDSVLHINGRRQKHYALQNDQEYFAELSESYFGTNDFFPFVRAELKEHDPAGYEMIRAVWGTGGKPTTRPAGPSGHLAAPGEPWAFAALDAPSPIVSSGFIFDPPPTPGCHASTIVEMPDGIAAAWFAGKDEGADDVGIWFSRLADGKWTAPVEVANGVESEKKRYPTWNPVLFPQKEGPLLLFYKMGPSPSKWWGMLKSSADGGKTWTAPTRLPEGILGPVKNKAILLADGTLLCGSSSEHDGWRVHFERSGDFGKTWTRTEPINDGKEFGIIQPTFLVHPDGKLQALCRSRQKRVVETWSSDGGKTWSKPAATELPNPNSGIDAVTLKDGRHLLVYNPVERGRSPLSVAISKDGKLWTRLIDLETVAGEYSYPAVIQSRDGLVQITYTHKRKHIKHVVVDPSKSAAEPK